MSSAIELSTEGEIWEGGGERYRLEKVVGNGAFGVVWRARDSQNEQVKRATAEETSSTDARARAHTHTHATRHSHMNRFEERAFFESSREERAWESWPSGRDEPPDATPPKMPTQ